MMPEHTQNQKPSKPYPDFPLYAHSVKRWAKKIKGKVHYFGRWDDPAGALKEYDDFIAGKTPTKAKTPRASRPAKPRNGNTKAKAPKKPRADFPLFPHPCGQWSKKIKGKHYYFGPWADPEGALTRYNNERPGIDSGQGQYAGNSDEADVAYALNRFLAYVELSVDTGRMSKRTAADYRATCARLDGGTSIAMNRKLTSIGPADFERLYGELAQTRKTIISLGTEIQRIRRIFAWAYEADLLPAPVKFGPIFKRPNRQELREMKTKSPPKMFSAAEVVALLKTAKPQMRAMILLAVNCAFGNADLAWLTFDGLNLDEGWHTFARVKKFIRRACPLWPETVRALRAYLKIRKPAKDPQHEQYVFLTQKCRNPWFNKRDCSPISQAFVKLMKKTQLTYPDKSKPQPLQRLGRNFYALRHTFATYARHAKDRDAVRFIMGHVDSDMLSVYEEYEKNELPLEKSRLKHVAQVVRSRIMREKKRLEAEEAASA